MLMEPFLANSVGVMEPSQVLYSQQRETFSPSNTSLGY